MSWGIIMGKNTGCNEQHPDQLILLRISDKSQNDIPAQQSVCTSG